MSYDKPYRTRHSTLVTAGSGLTTVSYAIPVPRGKSGRVIDYGMEGVTTTFTTEGEICIGTSHGNASYGAIFPTDGAAADTPLSVRGQYFPVSASTAETVTSDYIVGETTATMAAGRKVVMTVVISTDGVGTAFVEMEWSN